MNLENLTEINETDELTDRLTAIELYEDGITETPSLDEIRMEILNDVESLGYNEDDVSLDFSNEFLNDIGSFDSFE